MFVVIFLRLIRSYNTIPSHGRHAVEFTSEVDGMAGITPGFFYTITGTLTDLATGAKCQIAHGSLSGSLVGEIIP